MAKLFTPEFCALLDELKALDKKITRQMEDVYEALIEQSIITEDKIYKNTLEIINKKRAIRIKLKEMHDKFLEERGEK